MRVMASILGLLAGAIVVASGCASPPVAMRGADTLVWPPPPDTPRIAFVQTIERADDLGIQRGLLSRLGDLLFGQEDLRLVRPMAVIEVKGIVYVADPGVRGVHRFDKMAARHDVLRFADGQGLPSPVGLALGEAGQVYVTDSALGKVFVITPGAKSVVGVKLSVALRQPTGIAVDAATGRLWVADTGAHNIQQFGREGTLLSTIGRRGDGEGDFNFPTFLWRDQHGVLYVSDSLNFRIQTFDESGVFVGKFGRQGDGSGDLARQKGIATDSRGHVYVVDGLQHAVQIYDPAGRFLLAVGRQGIDRGEFWSPAGIYITPEDSIYVADPYNQRVQVLRFIGGSK